MTLLCGWLAAGPDTGEAAVQALGAALQAASL